MKEESKNDIPKYLEDFLEPTRSSIEKLLSAFDGLSIETQIKLLSKIEGKINHWSFPNINYLYKKVFLKAYESPNSYVRYISVRNLVQIMYGDDEELNKFIAEVEKDKSSLVRNARYETNSKFVLLGEGSFTEQTHDERLARVRSGHLDGKSFASALKKAARDKLFEDNNAHIELIELIDEYLSNDFNNEDFYMERSEIVDGFIDHSEMQELQALWDVVPKLPDLAGKLLVQKLPNRAKMGREFYKNILNDLTDEQLECLLMRRDVVAEEFRKEVFWRDEIPSDNEDEFMPYRQFWSQASLYNFRLSDEEFEKILSLPSKEQQKRLESLSQAHSLELHQYLAIIRTLQKLDEYSWESPYIVWAEERLKERINQDYFGDKQLILLRLYNLAYESRNWRSSEDLYSAEEILFPAKVEGDIWKTFQAFIVAFKDSNLLLKDLHKTDYEDWEEEEEEKDLDGKLATVFDELFFQVASIKKMITETRFLIIVIAVVLAVAIVF
jgi:hypothetical protein